MVRYCYIWSILFLLFYRFFVVVFILSVSSFLFCWFFYMVAYFDFLFWSCVHLVQVFSLWLLDIYLTVVRVLTISLIFLTFLLWCPEKIPQNYFSSHMLQCQCQNLDFLFVQNCQRYSFIIVIVFEFFQIWFLSVVTVLQNYNLTIFLLHIVFCTFIYFILLLFFVQAEEFTSAFLWSRYSWNVWKAGLCGSFDVIAQ